MKEIFEGYSPPLTLELFRLMLETNSRMDSEGENIEVIRPCDSGSPFTVFHCGHKKTAPFQAGS